jgi:glycosyltransferase involved in cell wall biosynthesis
MSARHAGPASRDVHVLIELSSADLRIGAVNDALDLAELSAPLGVRFTICGPLTPEFRAAAAERSAATLPASSRVFSRREFPLYAIDAARWLARLRRLRPDVVHLNYPGFGPSLACAARLAGIPIVARAGPVVEGNPSLRWVDAYAANCRPQAEDLLASAVADRVVVTGDLYRPNRLAATMTLERPLPPRRPGRPRIVFLGQLVERKGIHVLIEAMAALGGEAELLIVGGDWSAGGYARDLRALARRLGVDGSIAFENHRSDVGAILATADIFVLPSFSEARPRSIIEALSLGIPVVATAVGGVPSLVAQAETGLLVPAGDSAALADALARLVRSRELRERFGADARARAAREFDPERTARQYVEIYRSLVGHRDRLRGAHHSRLRAAELQARSAKPIAGVGREV